MYFMFSYEMVKQVHPLERTPKKHRGEKSVVLTGPRVRVTACLEEIAEGKQRSQLSRQVGSTETSVTSEQVPLVGVSMKHIGKEAREFH